MPDDSTHPLMPGVRCAEIRNPDWPRTLHDKQLTGFSPLACGMDAAPEIRTTIEVGGELGWVESVQVAGEPCLLVGDGRLRLVGLDGGVIWTAERDGAFCFCGDLRGNGRDGILLGGGPELLLLDAATGEVDWSYRFDPPYTQVRVRVGNVLPDRPGLEAAVFLAYGEEGCLIHFPPEGEPQFVWQRTVVVEDEWPERHDHGCDIALDLSVPDEPVIWNVRHHRCRGFNARTGKMLSSLVYRIEGAYLRNYGAWDLGTGKGGRPLICVVAERVQKHVHAIRLARSGENELAWHHYYGELYHVPGVAVEQVAIADVDGDGETELVYNVRDPEHKFRSFVRVRDGDTGDLEVELQNAWCVGTFSDLGAEGASGLLVLQALEGTTPVQGELTVYRFEGAGDLTEIATLPNAGVWGPPTLPGEGGNDLLLRQSQDGGSLLVRYVLRDGDLRPVSRTAAGGALKDAPIRAVLQMPDGQQAFLAAARGALSAFTWAGDRLWNLPLEGGAPATLSAADINEDGRAELVAHAPGGRVRVFSFDPPEEPREVADYEFLGVRARHSPLLYDLEDTGEYCLIAPGSTREGEIALRAYRPDGSCLWETALGVPTAQNGTAVAWNAGHFLPGPRAGVALSVNNSLRNIEGTYLLDGLNGRVLWHRTVHREENRVRPYIPHGIPTAFDIDGNGLEEVGMDMLSYMAFLRGSDGGFVSVHHTENIRREDALYAGNLYNSYCPVYRHPNDREPHWFVPLGGYGSFGLMNPDPRSGAWREDPGYDIPHRIGMVDVDGDGVMEVGYALKNSAVFTCRDLWTGEVKWELELPAAPDGPVITADFDGDGRGEFLTGRWCIGTDANGRGEIRWESPVPSGWAIVADFDGDGVGEIACAGRGKVYILKGRE